MKYDIFLSYSNKDRNEVHRLAHDLKSHEISVWLDEWEVGLGDNIIQKVEAGLADSRYLGIWLTDNSVGSGWVRKEWHSLFWQEIENDRVTVLPLLAEDCEVPLFLRGKRYADFRTDYEHGFNELLQFLKNRSPIVKDQVIGYEEFAIPDEKFKRKDVSWFDGRWIPVLGPPISVDALYRTSQFHQVPDETKIHFFDIKIAKDKCCWYSSANEIDRYEFKNTRRSVGIFSIDISLKKFYQEIKWSFSQGKAVQGKTNDPVLDVTILNNSHYSYVVTSIGVCPLALWSIPKAIPQPRVIKRFASYALHCDFSQVLNYLELDDPILVPSGSPFRFELRLLDFVDEVNWYRRNESLVSVVINHDKETCLLSGNIHLGVMG